MDARSPFKRFVDDELLRWQAAVIHLILFCTVVGYSVLSEEIVPPFSALWFGIIALHFIFTYANEDRRDAETQLVEKRKTHRLELGDDGELVEIAEEEETGKRKVM
jgi:hypothetical protein